jgi:exodeoxyribonuclease-5
MFDGIMIRSQFGAPALVESIEGVKHKELGDRFDFGYALTVHKAQGSQARTVVLFEERFQKSDDEQWRRWLYTAVTRARENLYIIGQ